ncbi:YbdK family carboxylate-amine ligase [Cryobacterium sp. Y11]|uniref:carboxylate-amine ligase n=1 Tax=Cryobacterium sp. Y11 TaxID=2045016 RepID=UPI001304E904|nr:YbdK family carboxylate-amine ligase [Cryobacterium sp. Y11]
MRTFGIEEEFIFLKPTTLRPANVGEALHTELLGHSAVSRFVSHEFLAAQIERSTPVFDRFEQASADLLAFRFRLARAAEARAVLASGVGAPLQTEGWPEVTNAERYHTVETEFWGLVPDHLINGLHVHVGIPNRDTEIHALNRVRVWLPTLLALAVNSPFWLGADTGFSSWRSVHMRRWSTIGCPPIFTDAADYDRRIRRLVGVGGTYDLRTISWNARLAEDHPTVEIRVCDAQLGAPSTLLLAALTSAVVTTALRGGKDIGAERQRAAMRAGGQSALAALFGHARTAHV